MHLSTLQIVFLAMKILFASTVPIKLMTHLTFSFNLDCNQQILIGNGYCNDETNVPECNFDGGDCCGLCINVDYCTNCTCLGNMTVSGVYNPLVGNSYCDDETNVLECNFDGGDCCLSNMTSLMYVSCGGHYASSCAECPQGNGASWCNGDCIWANGKCSALNGSCSECNCYHNETCSAGYHPLVGDGYCHDETNTEQCDFDGGDCCSSNDDFSGSVSCGNHNAISCSECPQGNGASWCNGDCQWKNTECILISDVNTEFCTHCHCLE